MADTNLNFYGLENAIHEKWELACSRLSPPEKWNSLLFRGAVVVAMFDYGIGDDDDLKSQRIAKRNYNNYPHLATLPNGKPRPPFPSGRSWWIGLPPKYLWVDLEYLAKRAGMMGPRPASFRWQRRSS